MLYLGRMVRYEEDSSIIFIVDLFTGLFIHGTGLGNQPGSCGYYWPYYSQAYVEQYNIFDIEIPSGSVSGIPGQSYSYSTSATDTDGDQVRYMFDWGDGSTSVTGPFDSDISATESHS